MSRQTAGEAFLAALGKAGYEADDVVAEQRLAQISRTIDELALLEVAVDKAGVLIDGARGQQVANPALAAIARHRTLLDKLLTQAFEDDTETTSQKAARAARTRWAKNRGAA
jgi:hypothetical protein